MVRAKRKGKERRRRSSTGKSGRLRSSRAEKANGLGWDEAASKIRLASVGAFLMIREECEDLFGRLVKKGEKTNPKLKNFSLDFKLLRKPRKKGDELIKRARDYGAKIKKRFEKALDPDR